MIGCDAGAGARIDAGRFRPVLALVLAETGTRRIDGHQKVVLEARQAVADNTKATTVFREILGLGMGPARARIALCPYFWHGYAKTEDHQQAQASWCVFIRRSRR